MDPQDAVDFGRDALLIATLVAAPNLALGDGRRTRDRLDSSTDANPRADRGVCAETRRDGSCGFAYALPWILSRLLDYTEDLIADIPNTL